MPAGWARGRLPWEAEWECAARGGTRFAEYPWGKERPTSIRANIDRVMASTTPVDAHPQGCNAFGLYDMCGNVWEWCADVYDAEWYSVLRHNIANPRNEGTGGPRTLRGGCFESVATAGRCAFRHFFDSARRRRDVGFRVAYDVQESIDP